MSGLWLSALLLMTLVVSSFAPGIFFVGRLRWKPLEKLCGAVGISFFFTYLISLAAFVFRLPAWIHWAYLIVCAAGLIACRRDIARLMAAREVRRALAAFAMLLVWVLLLLMLTRHYAGALWSGDWIEHYRKATLFLDGGNPGRPGAGLLNRPPGMNLICAHFMAFVGRRFELFQLTCSYLNVLIFFPCCLLAPALIGRRATRVAIRPMLLAALFMLNPLLVENATYTWTKLLSGYYSVWGIWLYLAGVRKRDSIRMTAAFGAMAFGCLIHFAAVPYAAFIGLHYSLGPWWRERQRIAAMTRTACCTVIVLGTWYAWVIGMFGLGANAAANPTVGFYARHSAYQNVVRVTRNIVNTIVPLPLRESNTWFAQPSWWGHVRDHAFMAYEDQLLLCMGSIGSTVIICLTWRRLARRPTRPPTAVSLIVAFVAVSALLFVPAIRNLACIALPTTLLLVASIAVASFAVAQAFTNWRSGIPPASPEQRFWRWLLVIVPVIGIGAQDQYTEFGLVHICLQPLVLIGLTLLAASLPMLPRPIRIAVAIGAGIDFALGIFLHFSLQHLTFENGATHGLLAQAVQNWIEKRDAGLTFLGDHVGACAPAIQMVLVAGAIGLVLMIAIIRGKPGQRAG